MCSEFSDHRHGNTGGRVTFTHDSSEDGTAGEQQEELTRKSKSTQRAK